MIIQKKTIIDCFFAYLCADITILLFYNANDVKNETLFISFVGAFFSTLCMVAVVKILENTLLDTVLSGPVVFLLVAVLYNQNSVIRFAVESLYDGSIENRMERLFGAIFIDVLLVTGTFFWSEMHKKNKLFNKDKGYALQSLTIPGFAAYFLTISYMIMSLMMQTTEVNNFLKLIQTGYSYICFSAVALYVKVKKRRYELPSLIPVVLLGIHLLILTNLVGSKQIIIRAAIVIACALILQNKLSLNKIEVLLYASPLIMQGIVSVTELFSARFVNYANAWMLRYHVFRYDLSDLTMTFALRFKSMKYSAEVVKEAFLYALPSFLYGEKQEVLPMYNANVRSAGLEGFPMDYNDTVFSFGAQIGGFLGIIIVFFAVLVLQEWISKRVIKIKNVGPAILMTILGYFSYVESDLYMFLFNTRDVIIYIILALFVYKIFLRKHNLLEGEKNG